MKGIISGKRHETTTFFTTNVILRSVSVAVEESNFPKDKILRPDFVGIQDDVHHHCHSECRRREESNFPKDKILRPDFVGIQDDTAH